MRLYKKVLSLQLTMTSTDSFKVAVSAIFRNWTALQLAVNQGAAGPHSASIASWMIDATVQWFRENKDLERDEVEDFLAEILNNEFNLVVEDGSIREVSSLVCEFFQLCSTCADEATVMKRLEQLPNCDLSKCKVESPQEEAIPASDDANDDDSMEIEETNLPVDDGWTVVSRKKK